MKHLVIVESPSKAKTINKYLGSDYKVLASFGHIRDLPSKDGSVNPDDDFALKWEVTEGSEKHIKAISEALKSADTLILASDPDREGEAIAWHVIDELGKRRLLQNKSIKRVAFNEITKQAVKYAIEHPRQLDTELVNAYLARRALDYLVGFNLSPVLWKKLPGSRSAGRVQSVALRLICERENEIETFQTQEYWTIKGFFTNTKQDKFTAFLSTLNHQKLDKFALTSEKQAQETVDEVMQHSYQITDIQTKIQQRNPAPPFTTSTLQQEASRKLYMSTKNTMRTAQNLYEGIDINGETVGLITYMRTDSVALSSEALNACRSQIEKDYGINYLPDTPRFYKNKVKNAQEAHEAIRPTDMTRTPQSISGYLSKDEFRLYEMIYKRTLASQMQNAKFNKTSIEISSENNETKFKTGGLTPIFDGFLKVYFEDIDDKPTSFEYDDEDNFTDKLPSLELYEKTNITEATPEQHFTQSPPRYSEASLVKKLEELGIGRPSTYASIISVLQDREYVKLESRRFIPEDRGRLVSIFLEHFFSPYVQYDFTADMEDSLDAISEGKADWKQVLRDFWHNFSANTTSAEKLEYTEVLNKLQESLSAHIFPTEESKICPTCKTGTLNLKLGKFGAFIGCSNYPQCQYHRPLSNSPQAEMEQSADKELGQDTTTGQTVWLKKGPYGYYVQRGEIIKTPKTKTKSKTKGKSEEKPTDTASALSAPSTDTTGKRTGLPATISPQSVDLQTALALLALPKELGKDPKTGETIEAGIGKFGPFVKRASTYSSLAKTEDILTITLQRALAILSTKKSASTKLIGQHPQTGEDISTGSGRFGPYVKMGKIYASIPSSLSTPPTLAEAVELIEAKKTTPNTKKKKAPSKRKTNGKKA